MGFKLSKKKLQEHGRENMEEILNDIDANESVIMGMGFLLWNSINEAYKIGYANAKRKFVLNVKGWKWINKPFIQ